MSGLQVKKKGPFPPPGCPTILGQQTTVWFLATTYLLQECSVQGITCMALWCSLGRVLFHLHYLPHGSRWSWWPLSACRGVGQGLGSQSERWKHQLLATRPVDSDEGPGPSVWQNRVPTKVESTETSKVFIKRKKVQYVWTDTRADSEPLRCTLVAVWITFMGYFTWVFL